jgi:hypothetical protein
LNGNEPSNKFLVKILSHHKKTPPQTSDDRIFSSPSPSDLLTKHEPCEAPEVVPKLEFSSPKNHKKTPPQTSDNRASPSPSPFDLTKHEPCEAPKVVPILEFSSPWRFTADPLTETNFYFVLTRAFNSDAIESMFSNIRMRGGSHDATDANAAHYAIQNILKSGIIKSAPSANVSVDITSISTVIIPPTPTMTVVIPEEDLQFDLPDSINDSIAELRCESYHVGFGIISASVAMMAGYIIKTLEERIDCSCSEQFTTTSSCTPLLGLIHLRDRGALKYPKRSFVALVHSISNIVNEILPCLPPEGNPLKIVRSLLIDNVRLYFTCEIHRELTAETIIEKLVKPLITSFCKSRTDFTSSCNLHSKPLSRKVQSRRIFNSRSYLYL